MTDRSFTKHCFTVDLIKCGDIYQVKFTINPAFSTQGDYRKYFKLVAKVFWKGCLQITRTDYESMRDFLRQQPREVPLVFCPSFGQLYMNQKNLVEAKAQSPSIDPKERLVHQWNSLGFALDPCPSEIVADVNDSVGEHVLNVMSNYFFEKRQRLSNGSAYEKENDANEVFEQLCGLLQ